MTFNNCKKLTSITIPDAVTTIEDTAFQSCKSLKYVTISNKVKSVENYGSRAFSDCPNLIFYGQDKSYIQTYAKKNKIPLFKKDYRAHMAGYSFDLLQELFNHSSGKDTLRYYKIM